MSVFEPKFLYKNYVDDVSQITDSADTADNNKFKLFDRNDELEYVGFGETTGSRTITWTPDSAKTVSRIILQKINWKSFTIQYNVGQNFSPAISVSDNSDENIYIEFTAQEVNFIVITVSSTIVSGDPISIAELIITDEIMEFSTTQNAIEAPKIEAVSSQSAVQKSDGTYQKTYVRTVRQVQMSGHVTTDAERQKLFNVFEENKRNYVYFVPKPRTQSDVWDGVAIPCHWISGRSFEDFFGDLEINGYVGSIQLAQA